MFGPDNLPHTFRKDWVINANDSYWLPNPRPPLEGFAGIIGCERCERSLRQRMVYRYVIDRLAGSDGLAKGRKVSHRTLKLFEHENRVFGAELAKENDDLAHGLRGCREASPARCWPRGTAAPTSTAWGPRSSRSSGHARRTPPCCGRRRSTRGPGGDAAQPRGGQSRGGAGDVATRSPIWPSGASPPRRVGAGSRSPATTAPPSRSGAVRASPATPTRCRAGSRPPTGRLYPISYGSSHIQAVAFKDAGLAAHTILTYGQSMDPTKAISSDQTRLFSRERWVRFPWTDAQSGVARCAATS